MSISILQNPSKAELESITPLLKEREILSKIQESNIRIEYQAKESYVFIILYLPEYNIKTRSIENTEVDIYFNKENNNVHIFAYKTLYFFEKYKLEILALPHNSFGVFIKKFLDIVLEDESKIIEHILEDTESVKKEYNNGEDTYSIIRHLTRNEINISSLKLISANQNKLISLLSKNISKDSMEIIDYKRAYVSEELEYEHEFCKTLMDSINTKFQVKNTEALYVFTKYSFIVFLATLAVAFFTLVHTDDTAGKTYVLLSIVFSLLSAVSVHSLFKK